MDADAEGRIYDASGNRTSISFDKGTVVVEAQNNGYQLTLDAETLRGETFHCTYSGSFEIKNNSTSGAPISLGSFAASQTVSQGDRGQKERSTRIAPAPSKDARLKLPAHAPQLPLSNDFPIKVK